MLFNSVKFLFFFPIVTILYFALPHRYRWFMLLMASCVFYMAFIPVYILILAVTIVIDYAAGIWIENSTGKKKLFYLIASIISTCLVLFIFKYFGFFNANFKAIADFIGWNYSIPALKLILPIGLSFHTFQSLSYVIEVYRGKQKAEHNFGIYSLYVMFYPQLVAGPIERPQNLLHQFYEKHEIEYTRIVDGLKLMTWGMFKKVVIADRLALFVNTAFNNTDNYSGISFVIATVFFAYQIYCDFSGYSDIAIGSAQVMGFRLMDNFNRPYFSKSISEFWKRWHISLSSWFRDYLYISLGGNRVPLYFWYFNLFFTFLVSGLWHGANWTYVVWGALNGFYLIFGIISYPVRSKIVTLIGLKTRPVLHKYIQLSITFFLVCFAWIFFRANSLKDALHVIKSIVLHTPSDIHALIQNKLPADSYLLGQDINNFIIAVVSILFLIIVHYLQRHGSIRHMLSDKPAVLRWAIYYLMILSIFFYGMFTLNQFIYFQF